MKKRFYFLGDSPAFVENTIDQRIKSLKDKINTLEAERSPNGSLTKGQAFVHAFGLHMSQAAKEFLEENKHIAIAAALTGSPANKQDAAE